MSTQTQLAQIPVDEEPESFYLTVACQTPLIQAVAGMFLTEDYNLRVGGDPEAFGYGLANISNPRTDRCVEVYDHAVAAGLRRVLAVTCHAQAHDGNLEPGNLVLCDVFLDLRGVYEYIKGWLDGE